MTTRWRVLAPCAVSALLLAGLGALPDAAAASTSADTETQSTRTVTVLLTAPVPTALHRLAARHDLARHQRVRRLHGLVPSASERRHVAVRLRARGLHVTGQSTWSVTATGSASRVRSVLASPRDLGRAVGTAVADDTPLLRPLATTTGQNYRDAYAAPGSATDTGSNPAVARSTIATIQFASFDPANLTTYAQSVGLPDPVASGQFKTVTVLNGPAADDPTTTKDDGGPDEVALDQESVLATAPLARQRAYLAPNSFNGFISALSSVATDASTYNITALSISWGGCESDFAPASKYFEQQLTALAAAGVTVFNSSGDTGVYCTGSKGTTNEPSYPASSPQVVAVGGTSLTRPAAAWTETAWSCTSQTACLKGGSGGGASSIFSRPDWQTTAAPSATKRLVPDISAVADPNTGFRVYTHKQWTQYGGTSLAAPVTASLFAAALATSGRSPIGDLHAQLYADYAQRSAIDFRDVVTGCNGPGACAGVGYDTVTGLGSVFWPALLGSAGQTGPSQPTQPTQPAPLTQPTTTQPSANQPASTPAPTVRASLRVAKVRHGRGVVTAQWETVQRSAIAWLTTQVSVVDVTAKRVLLRTTGYSGLRAIRVKRGHVLRLVATAGDVQGQRGGVTLTKRVR